MTISSRKKVSALKWAGTFADAIAACALVGVLVLTVTTIVLRSLRLNLPDSLDLSSLLMGIAMFWGLSVAFLNGSNIRVELLGSFLGPVGKRWLLVVSNLVAVSFITVMAYAGFLHWQKVIYSGETTSQLRIEIWPFVGIAWLGLCATVLAALVAAFLRPSGEDRQDTNEVQEFKE